MNTPPGPEPPWKPGELRVMVVDDEDDVRLGLRLLADLYAEEDRLEETDSEGHHEQRNPVDLIGEVVTPERRRLDDSEERVRAARQQDRCVVVASSEFEELLDFADTIHVMCLGRLVATLSGETTYRKILTAALP